MSLDYSFLGSKYYFSPIIRKLSSEEIKFSISDGWATSSYKFNFCYSKILMLPS